MRGPVGEVTALNKFFKKKAAICRTCVLSEHGCGCLGAYESCSVREVKEEMKGILIIADERKM